MLEVCQREFEIVAEDGWRPHTRSDKRINRNESNDFKDWKVNQFVYCNGGENILEGRKCLADFLRQNNQSISHRQDQKERRREVCAEVLWYDNRVQVINNDAPIWH